MLEDFHEFAREVRLYTVALASLAKKSVMLRVLFMPSVAEASCDFARMFCIGDGFRAFDIVDIATFFMNLKQKIACSYFTIRNLAVFSIS